MVKTIRNWIDEEIKTLNEFRESYLMKDHKLEGDFKYFSYSKDMTGYKLTYNNLGSEIGKRMNGTKFLEYLEFTNETLKAITRKN